MAVNDAVPFPIKNQAFRFTVCIRNYTTGNPLTGGLTGLSGTASGDGAAFATTGITVAEIGTTGFVTVDVAAAQMNVTSLVVNVSATNTNAVNAIVEIPTLNVSQIADNAMLQTVVRLEQMVKQCFDFLVNESTLNGTTLSVKGSDGSTILSGTYSNNGVTSTKGQLT